MIPTEVIPGANEIRPTGIATPTPTPTPTPTATMVAKMEEGTYEIEDAGHRKIVVKKPNIVAATYFPTYFKPACADNKAFMSAMITLPYVFSISDRVIPPFQKESDILELLQELGEVGKDAVDKIVIEKFLMPRAAALENEFDIAVKK